MSERHERLPPSTGSYLTIASSTKPAASIASLMASAARSVPASFFSASRFHLAHRSAPSIPQKRKDPPLRSPVARAAAAEPSAERADERSDTDAGTLNSASPSDEYGSGRITCESCSEAISIRDEATGTFTVKHWEAHREAW